MAVVKNGTNLWEVLAGRAPGRPLGPADTDLWQAVLDRLNPAKARPHLREGIEEVALTSMRGGPYVMLRSPDPGESSYLRLTPEEVELAHHMDGTRTVAALVGEFTRISGRLAPDHVLRVVADLAGNRMLQELPLNAFRPLERARAGHQPLPERMGRGMLATVRGKRMVLVNPDRVVTLLYRAGGRLLFTRLAAVLMATIAVAGIALFVRTWTGGAQSVFLVGGSYATGALVLLGLNVAALSCHELGHALAAKRAGRRVPAMGVLLYFGLPSVFVDTTDVWMAGRRQRMLTSAAGPFAALTLAGAVQLVALYYPPLGPVAFKIAFVWYLNSLFNLNPLMALDGYYLFMDWLELPNLRPRAIAMLVGWVRRRRPRWKELDREGHLIAVYAVLAALWLVVMMNMLVRMYRERVGGMAVGLWHAGPVARLLLLSIALALAAPIVYALLAMMGRTWRRMGLRLQERRRTADLPRRVDALRGTALGTLPPEKLTALAQDARWLRPRTGEQVLAAGASPDSVLVVVEGALEGRRPGDPPGSIRARSGPGELVGAAAALTATTTALAWNTAGTNLLALPVRIFAQVVGPFVKAPAPADRAEAETILDEAPALAGLSEEDRLVLLPHLRPVDLGPGQDVEVGVGQAAVVGSGVLETREHGAGQTDWEFLSRHADGAQPQLQTQELAPVVQHRSEPLGQEVPTVAIQFRRGALVGPPRSPDPIRAVARTRARVWPLPALAGGLGALLATGRPAGVAALPSPVGSAGVSPQVGVHPSDHPPLTPRPGEQPTGDDEADGRLLRALFIVLVVILLLALLTGRIAALDGVAWAELPDQRILFTAEQGEIGIVVSGEQVRLHRGDRRHLEEGDRIKTERDSTGRLTFRGGGEVVVCPSADMTVGPIAVSPTRPAHPSAKLTLYRGALWADTQSRTAAFLPAKLTVDSPGRHVASSGDSVFVVVAGLSNPVEVAAGEVQVNGDLQPVTPGEVGCPGSSTTPLYPSVPAGVEPTGVEPTSSSFPGTSPAQSPQARSSPQPSPTDPGFTRSPTGPGPALSPTDPGSIVSPTDPGSIVSPTDPGSIVSPTDPGPTTSPTDPGFTRSPTDPGPALSPTDPGSIVSPTDPPRQPSRREPSADQPPDSNDLPDDPRDSEERPPSRMTTNRSPISDR